MKSFAEKSITEKISLLVRFRLGNWKSNGLENFWISVWKNSVQRQVFNDNAIEFEMSSLFSRFIENEGMKTAPHRAHILQMYILFVKSYS